MIIKTIDQIYEITEPKENNITMFSDLVKLDRGNLICIAARPGMGKTSLALHMALEYAKKSYKTVYIFTPKTSAIQIYQRMICYLAEVDLHKLNNNSLSKEQKEAVKLAEEYLRILNIVIDDEPVLTVEMIEEILEKESDLGLVIIDSLQYVNCSRQMEILAQETSIITRELKSFSKRKNIPVILTHKLNRIIEERENKRPLLGDLREDGALAQDFDTIIFIYRGEYYHDISKNCSQAEIIVAKNRYDSVKTILLEWQGRYGKFSEVDKEV